MKTEGYIPSTEEINSAEQLMSPEQRLASELREKLMDDNFESPKIVTEQQIEAVIQETSEVATILNQFGKPWFLAGGTSLELAQGEITRNHQDSDVAMYYEDIADFFDYAEGLGYNFADSVGNPIHTKEELLAQHENAFIHKSDQTKPGTSGFELMFLRKNENGEVIFTADENLSFPTSLYEGAQKYTAINGQEVPLTPKGIQILYKVFDGRQKDYLDVKTFLPTLSLAEREQLDGYIESLGMTFLVGDRETQNLDELMQLAEATSSEVKSNYIGEKVNEVISSSTERFNTAIVKIYEIAQGTDTPENFLAEIKNEFGEELVVRREQELRAAAMFIAGDNKPSPEEFKDFAYRAFNLSQGLEDEVKRTADNMPRWEVRKRNEYLVKS